MHCRIGCRLNGGFIECFDPSATINVGGTDKNRSRLSNGDLLKIGALRIEVVIPQDSKPAATFDIGFDDIASTQVADASIPFQPEADFFDETTIEPPTAQELRELEASRLILNSPSSPDDYLDDQPESQTLADNTTATPERDNFVANSNAKEHRPAEVERDQDTDSEAATSSNDDSKSSRSGQSSKPIFEFDSVEPDDIKLTEEDLNVIENMTGNSLVLQDLDAVVSETFPEHVRDQSTSKEVADTQAQETNSDSENLIPDGVDSGKCYHWTGKTVLPTVELLEQRSSELQCYQVRKNVNLVSCTFAEIKQAVASKDGPKIFVLTNNTEDELHSFFIAKPWNDRLGHPQAISMFLTLLPAKNIERLFANIDTCIMVQGSDVELVRLSQNLEKQSR